MYRDALHDAIVGLAGAVSAARNDSVWSAGEKAQLKLIFSGLTDRVALIALNGVSVDALPGARLIAVVETVRGAQAGLGAAFTPAERALSLQALWATLPAILALVPDAGDLLIV